MLPFGVAIAALLASASGAIRASGPEVGESHKSVESVVIGAGCQPPHPIESAAAPAHHYHPHLLHPTHTRDRHRGDANDGASASFEVKHDAAQFLVFHFKYFNLAPSAVITITDLHELHDPQSQQQFYDQQSTSDQDFFTPPMHSNHVLIEYTRTTTAAAAPTSNQSAVSPQRDSNDCFGFHIDEYRFAVFAPDDAFSHPVDADEVDACTTVDDESKEASCFKLDADIFEKSNPVVRLLIQKEFGAIFCTGWLFGCEGHILTNHHCISQQSEANATTIEFLAQSPTCSQKCDSPRLCRGKIEAISAQIIAFSPETQLDFTLLLPRLSPARLRTMVERYGFLSMRASGALLEERIFIPQHPAGFGKRIAMKHSTTYGRVVSLSERGCNVRNDSVGYLLDTQGGSSGAPVVAHSDSSVIGLHYCGGCHNTAIPASEIVQTLESVNVLPKCAVSELQWPPPADLDGGATEEAGS